ncbi:MAG: aminopeptidase P family protein [Clostridia bacterium]|nr:aminopeptidase P family protein [Clostridia bacterium]
MSVSSILNLKSALGKGEAFLITSEENMRYVTGFPHSEGRVLITGNEALFFVDSRYIEAVQKSVDSCEVVLMTSFHKQLGEYAKKLGVKTVFTEAEGISVADFLVLCKNVSCEFKAEKADELLTSLRRRKSEEEKHKILAAQAIAEKAFDHILGFIKEGVTEREIALELDFFMLKNGAEAISFDTIAVSGKNTSLPHGVPSSKKIAKGDFITMDYGAVVNGYHSDMTRTVAVGEISSKQAEIYETVLKAQKNSLKVLNAGISGFDADKAARDIIENAGYGKFFGHGTGHGVGLQIHESPRLSPKSKHTLEIGDVVTVEPGIYLPDEFGVRIEDMAYITENGFENLTKTQKSLIIL